MCYLCSQGFRDRGDGMATEVMWLCVGAGAFGGFLLGRWSAEARRARYDMRRTWESRKNYRS